MQEYYIFGHLEDIMRTETEEIRDNLKYLSLLARDYPSQAAAERVQARTARKLLCCSDEIPRWCESSCAQVEASSIAGESMFTFDSPVNGK